MQEDQKKMDLCAYLRSLPDVEDPFPPFKPEEPSCIPSFSDADKMAAEIEHASACNCLVSRQTLQQSYEHAAELLEQCAGVRSIEGHQDTYYYSEKNMSDNFAMIAMLITEKDAPRTIAEMVRYHSKVYPMATPLRYFLEPPYRWSKDYLRDALAAMRQDPRYGDIIQVSAFNSTPYLISTLHLTERYGRALADFGEESATTS